MIVIVWLASQPSCYEYTHTLTHYERTVSGGGHAVISGSSYCCSVDIADELFFASNQGLTLVHRRAQLEPCLTQQNTLHTLNTPLTRAIQPLRAPLLPYKALKFN